MDDLVIDNKIDFKTRTVTANAMMRANELVIFLHSSVGFYGQSSCSPSVRPKFSYLTHLRAIAEVRATIRNLFTVIWDQCKRMKSYQSDGLNL